MSDDDAWVRLHVCDGPRWSDVTRLGVAVSGGGDSIALMHILADCAPAKGVALEAATVDHGLRPGSAEEAAFVAETCKALGLRHETLRWEDWDGHGNLQAEARAARYRLLGRWAGRRRLDSVALAHTLDDQAETFLMRLAREAGVDGLAAMDEVFERDGARFWRPALALERAELRDYLGRHRLGWRDDPSNDDASFDRVKARRALTALAPLGIDAAGLRAVAVNMAAAREALERSTWETARRVARETAGDVVFDRAELLLAPYEITRRLMLAALAWVSGAGYAPRREAVSDLIGAILHGRPHTLSGCIVATDARSVRIAREFNAVKDVSAPVGGLWDGRWRVEGPDAEGLVVRALGEAVSACVDWRGTGLPRASLLATPAVFDENTNTLVAAPLAGAANGYSAEFDPPRGDFFTSVLSH